MDTYGLDLHGADLVEKWLSCVTMNPILEMDQSSP